MLLQQETAHRRDYARLAITRDTLRSRTDLSAAQLPAARPQGPADYWPAVFAAWCPDASVTSTLCLGYAALGAVLLLVATFTVLLGGRPVPGEAMELSLDMAALDLDMEQLNEPSFREGFEAAALRGVRHASGDGALTGAFGYAPSVNEGVRVDADLQFSPEKEGAAQQLARKLTSRRLDGRGLFGGSFIRKYGQVELDAGSVSAAWLRLLATLDTLAAQPLLPSTLSLSPYRRPWKETANKRPPCLLDTNCRRNSGLPTVNVPTCCTCELISRVFMGVRHPWLFSASPAIAVGSSASAKSCPCRQLSLRGLRLLMLCRRCG